MGAFVYTAVAFDIGGTYLRSGAVCVDGGIEKFQKKPIKNFLSGISPNYLWDCLVAELTAYIRQIHLSPDAVVVIAFPGPIDHARHILGAPTLVGKSSVFPDLCQLIESATGYPTYILNDLSAAAWYFSTRTDARRFMVVTVSSGIGSKIFDRFYVEGVLDSPSYAGEIGHLTVDFTREAPLCDCGGKGHLGAIASGRGIERAVRNAARQHPFAFSKSACVRDFGATVDTLSNEEHIVPAAIAEDQWVLEIIGTVTRSLAQVLAAVFLGAGVEKIFVIGGFAEALSDTYLNLLLKEFKAVVVCDMFDYGMNNAIEVLVQAQESCLLGAAEYARNKLK